MASERGVSRRRPPNSPPTMRTGRPFRSWHLRPRRLRLRRRRRLADRRLEVGMGGFGQLRAELVAEHAAADLPHLAVLEVAELERPVGDADQPVDLEAEMARGPSSPRGSCLRAARPSARHWRPARGRASPRSGHRGRRRWRSPSLSVSRAAWSTRAVRAHAVAAQPAGRRQLQHAAPARRHWSAAAGLRC